MCDAYLNILIGKGAGTGWSLHGEARAAISCIRRAKAVVFDVGANVGRWSELLLQEIPGACVYMFEPSPGCQSRIKGNPALSGVKLIPAAVGDEPSTAVLHFSSETDGSASLHERGDTFFKGLEYSKLHVDVVTLDDVIEREGLEFVDFIKIDVEGHELSVMRGAQRALKNRRVGALAFEFGTGNINSKTFFRQFWDVLTAGGFRIHCITPGGVRVLIDEYYEDLEYFRGVSNYIAELNEHPFQ
jgi:FkbM family methyltransferase